MNAFLGLLVLLSLTFSVVGCAQAIVGVRRKDRKLQVYGIVTIGVSVGLDALHVIVDTLVRGP